MTKFVALVSGKGGVGKTTSALNIGQALVDLGKDVILVDGNIVTPNLAIHLGFMNPEGTLNKFLRKEKELKEVIYLHESGISFIPSSPSYSEFQKTNPQNISKIFERLDNTVDFVLIDAPSGLGYDLHQILKNTEEVLIVVNPNLSSVADALKTIQLANATNNSIAGILLNKTNKGKHELSEKEVEEILSHHILANIRTCNKIKKSTHKQMPLNYLYPRSKSAKEFVKVAKHLSLDYTK
jgi:septum site-determining protein MinD